MSSVNSFGSVAMAGSTASANIEGFVYTSMNAIYQTALSFTSQNFGAGKIQQNDEDSLLLSWNCGLRRNCDGRRSCFLRSSAP